MVVSAGNKSFSEHYDRDRTGQHINDPYISDKAYSEPTVCPSCNAVYHKKRWVFDEKLLTEAKKNKDVKYHKCPADRKIEDKFAMGKITLSGAFVKEHKGEFINIIKHEEKMALENNPLDRLIQLTETDKGLYVETTSDALAMRIGHHIKNAYKVSEEEIKFRAGDKYVEIHWNKDQ